MGTCGYGGIGPQLPREDAVTLIVRPAEKEAVLQSYYLFVTISVTIDPYFNI